ncbi:Tyrosine-protein kinase Wzc [Fimbriiglobus ruber]|uniref:Tyrosine-protein kinase Wzc n=2 Tax=Fimbriiglobus ruber TaxID=1908690 RepID=A0A225CZP6_9BACT|nr:Tyrosine-protein kinase Wzc [Fimbriiglobus ruber]
MRRRYPWAVFAGLTVGLGAAAAGYKSSPPAYKSSGLLRITPVALRMLYAQHDVVPSIFDGFVDVQVNIMKSRTVVESVLATPEWEEAVGDKPISAEAFLANLTVTHQVRSELIEVSYTDVNPKRASFGVKLLFREYLRVHGGKAGNQRMAATDERVVQLSADLARLRKEAGEIAHKFGSDDLKELLQAKTQEVNRLETMLKDTEINVILMEAALGNSKDYDAMPVSEIATTDELLRRSIEEESRYETELRQLQKIYGPDHPDVVKVRDNLTDVRKRISDRAIAFRKFRRTSFVNNVGVLEGVPTPAAIDALRMRASKLREMYSQSLEKYLELGRANLRVSNLLEEAKATKDRLADNESKLDSLRVDSSVIGQINVINEGERPGGPAKDKRKMMGAAGGLGGFALGAGAVVALSLRNRKARRSTDLACLGVDVPVLGVLLEVSDAIPDAQQTAAFCIYSLVSTWQTDPELSAARVIAIAGTSRGDGKSELTAALGTALAVTGQRVLIIDFDLIGRRFSSAPDQVTDRATVGLANVLCETRGLAECVTKSWQPNLWILPLGALGNRQRAGLRAESIAAVFKAAAASYDVVLVDTGALSDAIESPIVCREAESTWMVVVRDADALTTRKAVAQLRAAGTPVGAVVFNRGEPCELAGRQAALRAFIEKGALLPDPIPGLGPVTQAVMNATRPSGRVEPIDLALREVEARRSEEAPLLQEGARDRASEVRDRVLGQRFPSRLLQDQDVARLDQNPLPGVFEGPVQTDENGNLHPVPGLSDDRDLTGRREPDPALQKLTAQVVGVKPAVHERPADHGDRFEDVQVPVPGQGERPRREQPAREEQLAPPGLYQNHVPVFQDKVVWVNRERLPDTLADRHPDGPPATPLIRGGVVHAPLRSRHVAVRSPLDNDVVLGLTSRESAGPGQGVEQVVLPGLQVERVAGGPPGLGNERAARTDTGVPAAGPGGGGASVFPEDENVVKTDPE